MVSKFPYTILIATLLTAFLGSSSLHAAATPVACFNEVAAGGAHTVVVRGDHAFFDTTFGRGDNSYKQLNISSGGYTEVSAGYRHTLAIDSLGKLWASGLNTDGQLGINQTGSSYSRTQVGTRSDWSSVATGDTHSAGVTADGFLWTWGNLALLGINASADVRLPAQVGFDDDWSSVSAGAYHTVAIKQDGSLWAWGSNNYGQLGDGTTAFRATPTQINPLTAVWSDVSVGGLFTVALKDDGTLWTWGYDAHGQLGLGDQATNYQAIPVQVGTDSDWETISAGGHYAMAIKTNGSLWTWGWNENGQLGDGTTTDRNTPGMLVNSEGPWQAISAGTGDETTSIYRAKGHSIGLKADGSVWTWGYNLQGQLGRSSSPANFSSVPGQILNFTMTPGAVVGGTVSPSTAQALDCDDSPKVFTFTPNEHYHFSHYTTGANYCPFGSLGDNGDGTRYWSADENNIEANCNTAGAVFLIDTHTLQYTALEHGTISGTATQTIDYGANGTAVVATPDTGYHFLSWSDGVTTASRTDTNIMADLSVTASFSINTYNVNSSVSGGNGTIDPVDNQTVDYGATPTFDLDSADGYQIGSVTGSCGGTLVNTTFTTTPVSANCTVVANFALKVPPVISEGDAVSVTMDEDADPTAFSLVLNATDANADVLSWSIFSNASKGSATASGTGNYKAINYTPNQDVNGSDSFAVQVSDGALTDIITVNVTINPVDDAPVIGEAPEVEVTMDEDSNPVEFSLTLNGSDADNDTLTWSISSDGSIGTASATGTGASKAIAYVPEQDQYGSDSFVVQLSDGALTDTITVNVIIYPGNDSPVFTSDEILPFNDGIALVGQITASDVEGDLVTFMLLESDDRNLFTLSPEGALSFNNPPDIKIPLDANGDNEYEIIVQADDNTVSVTHTSEQTITVKPAGCSFFTIPTGGGKIVVICL